MNSNTRLILVLFLAGAWASCRDKPDSKEIAEKENQKSLDTRTAERDAQFVVNQVSAHYAMVDWTKPVVKVKEQRELRDLAYQLQREHLRMIDQWKEYAENNNIVLPDSSVSSVKKEVDEFSAQDQDSAKLKSWVDDMLDKEKKMLSRLEDYMANAGDPALKVIIQAELPVIRMNRDQLMMLKSKL
jgi:predicted outer membrane protein